MKKEQRKWVFGGILFFWLFIAPNRTIYDILNNGISQVYAQQGVQYSYDSLGRVDTATYPDGTEVKYIYDRNGNMLSSVVQVKPAESEKPEQSGGSEAGKPGQGIGGGSGTGGSGQGTDGGSGTGGSGQGTSGGPGAGTPGSGDSGDAGTGGAGTGGADSEVQQPVVNTPHDTAQEIIIYNAFKKKKPVIKSLKVKEEKNKRYLKIKISQVGKNGSGIETGYQIQYATNSEFKKAKKLRVEKKKGKSVTSTEWKVKKKKTYYVRVRAYMKTKTGKLVYTKYSNTKKISV